MHIMKYLRGRGGGEGGKEYGGGLMEGLEKFRGRSQFLMALNFFLDLLFTASPQKGRVTSFKRAVYRRANQAGYGSWFSSTSDKAKTISQMHDRGT